MLGIGKGQSFLFWHSRILATKALVVRTVAPFEKLSTKTLVDARELCIQSRNRKTHLLMTAPAWRVAEDRSSTARNVALITLLTEFAV